MLCQLIISNTKATPPEKTASSVRNLTVVLYRAIACEFLKSLLSIFRELLEIIAVNRNGKRIPISKRQFFEGHKKLAILLNCDAPFAFLTVL